MLASLPALVIGWGLALIGLYFLGAELLGYPTSEENTSLAAMWAFLFSFGAVSIAGILASYAKFVSKTYVRQIYKYSIIVTAILFLGYAIIEMVMAFDKMTIES